METKDMIRPMLAAVTSALTFFALLGSTGAPAASPEQSEARGARDLRNNVCVNCRRDDHDSDNVAASRVERSQRIATKLIASNVCADPGPVAWFVEEEDHLSAFLNSQSAPRYK